MASTFLSFQIENRPFHSCTIHIAFFSWVNAGRQEHGGLAIVNFLDEASCDRCLHRLVQMSDAGKLPGIKSIGQSYIQGFAQLLERTWQSMTIYLKLFHIPLLEIHGRTLLSSKQSIQTKTEKDKAWPSAPRALKPCSSRHVFVRRIPAGAWASAAAPRNLAYFTVLASGRVEEKPIIFVPQHETFGALTPHMKRWKVLGGAFAWAVVRTPLASCHRFLESTISVVALIYTYHFGMLRREVKRFMTFGLWSNGMWPLSSLTGPKRTLTTHRTTVDVLDVRNMFRFVWKRCYGLCARGKQRPGIGGTRVLALSQICMDSHIWNAGCVGSFGRNNCPQLAGFVWPNDSWPRDWRSLGGCSIELFDVITPKGKCSTKYFVGLLKRVLLVSCLLLGYNVQHHSYWLYCRWRIEFSEQYQSLQ